MEKDGKWGAEEGALYSHFGAPPLGSHLSWADLYLCSLLLHHSIREVWYFQAAIWIEYTFIARNMTSSTIIISSLLVLLLAQIGAADTRSSIAAAANISHDIVIAGSNNSGRSNNNNIRGLKSPTYAPAPSFNDDGLLSYYDDEEDNMEVGLDGVRDGGLGEGGEEPVAEEVEEATTTNTPVVDVDYIPESSESTNIEDVVQPPPPVSSNEEGSPHPDGAVPPPSPASASGSVGKCSFCEKGMTNLDLIPPDTGGKDCAEVKGLADEYAEGSDMCDTIQKEQSVCCPEQSNYPYYDSPTVNEEPNNNDNVVVVNTTPPEGAMEGNIPSKGPLEDESPPEGGVYVGPTPTPPVMEGNSNEGSQVNAAAGNATTVSGGGDANEFVGDESGNSEGSTTVTSATAASVVPEVITTASPEEPTTTQPFGECIQNAKYEYKEDPLFICCQDHPDENICQLNKCMDFETEVITCQCKEVKGRTKEILKSNDPSAEFLPDDIEDFLDAMHECCPSSETSPSEFNDCYYDEVEEEIIEEIEQEYEDRPTNKPTPRPQAVYIPPGDDEDPVTQEEGQKEDFSNGQKDDSFQGMINTYLDGVESPDEMKSDKNVQVVAISLVVFFLITLLATAHLVMEHPDGICASFCRLILKCLCCVIRVLCLPCRAICCKGSDQTRSRRTHAPMRAPFPSDLELA
jgi:hypothetical protein